MRPRMIIGFVLMVGTIGCASPAQTVRKDHPALTVRAASDRLSDMEAATHNSDSSATPKPETEHTPKCSRCGKRSCTCTSEPNSSPNTCDDDSFGSAIARTLLGLPFTLPITIMNDDYDHYTEFPDYPYADDAPGSLLINSLSKGKKQSWTGNVQAFGVPGTDNVDRFGGRLVLDSAVRFGIDTEAGYWFRNHSGGDTTQAWIGDANLTFRFAESEHTQMRAGIGVNWLADQTKPESGVNFTYGIEWFPRKPWTVASVIDVGSLGSGTLFHNRSTVGVMTGATEVFVGYDYFQIDKVNIQGPVAGIGWRF